MVLLVAISLFNQIITQFKTFAFNQTKLIKDAIVLEARRGNLKPIIAALALMPILGEGVADLRALVTGRIRTATGLERIAENMAAVGGLGIITDLWQSAQFGSIASALGGPTVSDISKLTEGIVGAAQGKPGRLGRAVTRQIPVIGPAVSRALPR